MALISLVYVSYAAAEFSSDDLEQLLEVCRRNNRPMNITGMLMYRDNYFIQALEGEEKVVLDLYNKITKDQRHKRCVIALKEEITERSFPDWSMGFRALDGVDFSKYPEYHAYENFSPEYFSDNPSHAKSLLKTFKDETYF